MNPTETEGLKAQQDERMGVPSASEAHRWMACPGYLTAKKNWPKLEADDSEVCSTGNKIHEIMQYTIDDQSVEIPDTEREEWITNRLKELKDQVIARVFGTMEAVSRQIVEQRLWVTDAKGERQITAKPDWMGTDGKGTWLILEYKTGPRPVPDATQNWQIGTIGVALSGTVALMKESPADTIYGAVLQPLVTLMPSVVKLSTDQVVALRTQLLARLRALSAPNITQPRVPGMHCGYCPVRHACFECQSVAVIREKEWGSLEQLSPSQLVEIHRLLPAIDDRVRQVRAYIKQRLREDPASIPGLALKSVGSGHDVNDKIKFMRELAPIISKEEYWNNAEIPVALMREMWVQRMAEANGMTKTDMLKVWKDQFEPMLQARPSRELIVEVTSDTKVQAQPRS